MTQANQKMLNLGCGGCFHQDWVNVDFVSAGNGVIAHNLSKGIPFANDSADVVYHSHVLEHFSKDAGKEFIKECYRVLKPAGILRVAVPDLEQIARFYLQKLEERNGDDYDWMVIELIDQIARNYKGGGEMSKYLKQDNLRNADFVISRMGAEVKGALLKQEIRDKDQYKITCKIKQWFYSVRNWLKEKVTSQAKRIGKFRLRGEIHQWMYDRFSLTRLLESVGFSEVRVVSAFESNIENFDKYHLDVLGSGDIRKPDSLFVECVKPS